MVNPFSLVCLEMYLMGDSCFALENEPNCYFWLSLPMIPRWSKIWSILIENVQSSTITVIKKK